MSRRFYCRSRWGWPALLAASGALLLVAPSALASDAADAEALVLQVYYEGLPYDEASAITAAGSARLVELLSQPQTVAYHSNILAALGAAGHADAFPAIASYAAAGRSGELDAASYRALRSIPLAMGHLAAIDDRALAWLEAGALAHPSDPGWGRGAMHGPRLAAQRRDDCIRGLGIAGRDPAERTLHRLSGVRDTTSDGPHLHFRSYVSGLPLWPRRLEQSVAGTRRRTAIHLGQGLFRRLHRRGPA